MQSESIKKDRDCMKKIALTLTTILGLNAEELDVPLEQTLKPAVPAIGAPIFPDSSQYLNPQPIDEIRKTAGQEQLEKAKANQNQKLKNQQRARDQITPLLQNVVTALAKTDKDAIMYADAKLLILHIQSSVLVSNALENLIRTLVARQQTASLYAGSPNLSFPEIDVLITALKTSLFKLAKTPTFKNALQAVLATLPEQKKNSPPLNAATVIQIGTKNTAFQNFIQLLYTSVIPDLQKIQPDAEGCINLYNTFTQILEYTFDIQVKNKVRTRSEKGDYTHF